MLGSTQECNSEEYIYMYTGTCIRVYICMRNIQDGYSPDENNFTVDWKHVIITHILTMYIWWRTHKQSTLTHYMYSWNFSNTYASIVGKEYISHVQLCKYTDIKHVW